MKLFVSPTSPYARKCRALIIEKSLEHKIEVIECDPRSDPADLLEANPLGKVPALTREGAPALMDSPLICEFIDSLDDENWIPKRGASRILVLRQQALADGLIDLTIGRRIEMQRDSDKQWDFWSDRWERGVKRTLEALNDDRGQYERSVDLGALSVAVALHYLDLRFAEYDWRSDYPELGAFAARWDQRASFAQTRPPQ
ncbi:glutathione S-transferase [Oceanicaulis sp. MMSF_3324]|uniref:glutathione S-transferase n=1 Tax=Oceanicaulis sp. MMSF_3324 TaxID=3046702 RepID=UPI00273DF373|nr:glutathione S-transferase [Oceanicaulis sp. MMSF_3324]